MGTPPGQMWLIPTQGELRRGLLAEVAVATRTLRTACYAVPEELADILRPGMSVRVPWGRSGRLVDGWCLRLLERQWDHTRLAIAAITGSRPLLTPAMIELACWVSRYYCCPPGQVCRLMVPAAARMPPTRRVRFARLGSAAEPQRLSAAARRVMDALADGECPVSELLARTRVSSSLLARLHTRGLVEIERRALPDAAAAGEPVPDTHRGPVLDGGAQPAEAPSPAPEDQFELTTDQQAALEHIAPLLDRPGFHAFLLWGVSGSGKTEVYVRAMRRAVAAGRQAILLVPEIALTTQLVERLSRRFARLAVWHAELTPRQRARTWQTAAEGSADVVIGARSAVFAPCPRLGLIVVDEEQEPSFKSLSQPAYHARDVAIQRARLENIPVILGSATPALESWYNAHHSPQWSLLRLGQRLPGAQLPRTRLVPTGRPELGRPAAVLSSALAAALHHTLSRGRQAVLLHNRRGYALRLRCARCGLVLRCERCGVSLSYHRDSDQVRCHRCGRGHSAPAHCLDVTCGGSLVRSGLGIQRVEEELAREFPQARVIRLDRDTMRRRRDYEQALGRFARHEADILLGTQMVAKGLDFPGVELVGVIDADAPLALPDFRAAERVFQLVVQVAGRAGRGGGESLALVQALDPDSRVMRQALRMDYEAFATGELELRRQLFEPPYCRLIRLICADPVAARARSAAERLSASLSALAGRVHAGIRVGPAEPCPIPRQRGRFRLQVLIRVPRQASGARLLAEAADLKLLAPRVDRLVIDVDPLEML